MSSDPISRRTAVLGLLALGGCGFAPVYGDGGGLRGQIAFETPDNVAGFRMQDQLIRRLGQTETPRYILKTTLTLRRDPAAITSDGDTTRFNVIGRSEWSLHDIQSGGRVTSGTVQSFTSYAATGSTVATQAASTDADARLAVTLADMIVSRLLGLNSTLAP